MVTLEERKAGQLDEVAVALIGFCQKSQVVVLLLTAFVRTAVVVHFSATRNAFCAVIKRHVGLGADNGFDALLLALFVEVDDSIHVAVVGNSQCRLAILHGFRDQFIEARCSVEHGEFGVNMQVCKR